MDQVPPSNRVSLGQQVSNNLNRSPSIRNPISVQDIKGAQPKSHYKYEIYNKNEELLKDDVIGRKKHYQKDTNPVDPTYVMRTVSGRHLMQIGEVDKSKPKVLIQPIVKKDNHRHLRTEDINGASPKIPNLKKSVEIDEAEKRYISNRVTE
jgi:hypothetical protein